MVNESSLSIIVAALNEEKNLEDAVITVSRAAKKSFNEHEVIIFDDGSSDRTGEVAEALAKRDKQLKVIHHKSPKCLGGVYKEGLKLARMNYLILVNGKCDITQESLDKIFARRKEADIIIPYTINTSDRPIFRRVISKVFVELLNTIFRLKLRYYNHSVLCRRAIVHSVDIGANGYAFGAEVLIKLIKGGYNYIEVGVVDKFEKGVKTKAFYSNNLFSTFAFLFRMIYEVYFKTLPKNIRSHLKV